MSVLSYRPIKISSWLSKPSKTQMHYSRTLTFQTQKIIFYVNIADIIQNYFRIDMSFTIKISYYEFIFWSKTVL